MQTTSLAAVRHRLKVGVPLPFNVRNADQTLLLARGQVVATEAQMQALFDRGTLVDLAELMSARDLVRQLPRTALPRIWAHSFDSLNRALQCTPAEGFREAIDEAAAPVLALIERDPDLAIFHVLRQDTNADVAYGARRSLHAAITTFLVATRLAWDPASVERAFKVALTMNVSMLELQGLLSRQQAPLSAAQREELRSHPERSVALLEQAGITDDDWLRAVERHHEQEDGGGYPRGVTDVGEIASLVRRTDVYTSKLAARSYRDAMAADVAGREMFMRDPGHPMTAALVKEFGVYPPGCHVRLASGELAIVVQRGPTVTTPVVACLTNPRGAPLAEPVRVETSDKRRAVVALVGERQVSVRISPEKLVQLAVR
jgi:HD-GYP domain-containing protein (c-di-GMP phosphodiesterase class II)